MKNVSIIHKSFAVSEMPHLLLVIIMCMLLLSACENEPVEALGLKPTYFNALDFSEIRTEAPRGITNQGNIVKVGDYLLINERKQGIHVVDNANPSAPEYILFWNIPGNQNFTINQNFLYADNGPHLLVIDISDFDNIRFESYVEDAFFENLLEQYPEDEAGGTYFECPNPDLGLVKEWIPAVLINPSCRKN